MAITFPPPGTPVAGETQPLTVWTDSHGDARLDLPRGDYVHISAQVLRSESSAALWGSDGDWHVRVYRRTKPARWRRVRLAVTAVRVKEA